MLLGFDASHVSILQSKATMDLSRAVTVKSNTHQVDTKNLSFKLPERTKHTKMTWKRKFSKVSSQIKVSETQDIPDITHSLIWAHEENYYKWKYISNLQINSVADELKRYRKYINHYLMNILTFKMSQTVTLSSESFVITCLLSLNTWNFRMLGAPETKQKHNFKVA